MFGRNTDAEDNQPSAQSENSVTVGGKEGHVDRPADIIAFVGEGVTFKGTIRYKGTVRIDGRLEGEIHTDGVLVVGEKAVISAKIEAGTIACQGKINGDIVAKEKIRLMSPAVFEGSVKTPSISMDEGVLFNGTCQMQKGEGLGKSRETSIVESLEESLKVR